MFASIGLHRLQHPAHARLPHSDFESFIFRPWVETLAAFDVALAVCTLVVPKTLWSQKLELVLYVARRVRKLSRANPAQNKAARGKAFGGMIIDSYATVASLLECTLCNLAWTGVCWVGTSTVHYCKGL